MVKPFRTYSLVYTRVRLTASGVNTGFGGSANTRTTKSQSLKQDLLNGLLYGMLGDRPSTTKLKTFLPLDHTIRMSMPESWARAAILIRINSLSQGASGVLLSTVQGLTQLLNSNVIPQIPLRGSISASGDLSPLAYIAGLLEGQPTVSAWVTRQDDGTRQSLPSDRALMEKGITPVSLNPREALALVNGTSMSTAVAALAMHEVLHLATLSQVLTAMSVEALRGTDESFDPFLAHVRPHWGQAESARNIHGFLRGSRLVFRDHGNQDSSLRQDRYSIRTASQWIGPILEDLDLAYRQISTELNSATDNPLIDSESLRMVHGGNFQAMSITSAMEKVRQASQSMGRMLFTQCTEIINPATSRGLSPNLVFGEPSESFVFKGTDILIASLLSELGYLANPITPHVQTAEMGNQSLNSLALISARYTMDSASILTQLAAAHLVAVCQALDLRAFHLRFFSTLEQEFKASLECNLQIYVTDAEALPRLLEDSWNAYIAHWEAAPALDSTTRIPGAVHHVETLILPHLVASGDSLNALRSCTNELSKRAVYLYSQTRDQYLSTPNVSQSLGIASQRLHTYLRAELAIPAIGPHTLCQQAEHEVGAKPIVIGDLNETVRASMHEAGLYKVLVECLGEVDQEEIAGKESKS